MISNGRTVGAKSSDDRHYASCGVGGEPVFKKNRKTYL